MSRQSPPPCLSENSGASRFFVQNLLSSNPYQTNNIRDTEYHKDIKKIVFFSFLVGITNVSGTKRKYMDSFIQLFIHIKYEMTDINRSAVTFCIFHAVVLSQNITELGRSRINSIWFRIKGKSISWRFYSICPMWAIHESQNAGGSAA